jgi:hypothetical protein
MSYFLCPLPKREQLCHSLLIYNAAIHYVAMSSLRFFFRPAAFASFHKREEKSEEKKLAKTSLVEHKEEKITGTSTHTLKLLSDRMELGLSGEL